tara:strand:+ start:41 stop:481 length:441 start_codon:yes stop_codon:yes gene_type:complete
MKQFRNTSYYITEDGRVYSNGRQKRWMQPFTRANKYISYSLYLNGKVNQFLSHRLVMEVYKEASKLSVDHLDGNRSNNRIDNLEYVTAVENTRRSSIVVTASQGLPNYICYNKYRNNYRYIRQSKILKTSKNLDVIKEFKIKYENL